MNSPHVGLVCPSCRVALVMSERQGVEIDYCPQCRGVWLDRGELDKIIERASREMAAPQAVAPPAQQYGQQQYPQQGHGKHDHESYGRGQPKRKKSFFEELFD